MVREHMALSPSFYFSMSRQNMQHGHACFYHSDLYRWKVREVCCKNKFIKNTFIAKWVVNLKYPVPERGGSNTPAPGPGVCACWPLTAFCSAEPLCPMCNISPHPDSQPCLSCCLHRDRGTGSSIITTLRVFLQIRYKAPWEFLPIHDHSESSCRPSEGGYRPGYFLSSLVSWGLESLEVEECI